MESTKMIKALKELAADYSAPPSYIQVARDAVLKQLAAKNRVEMPAILDESQRKVFMDNIGHLEGFLESDDGAESVELMVNAYKHYCEKQKVEPDDEETEGM